ncbi:hypothetical protein V8E54_011007, partial [Elaphomyces granulatus]
PYLDDDIERHDFDPCISSCSKYNYDSQATAAQADVTVSQLHLQAASPVNNYSRAALVRDLLPSFFTTAAYNDHTSTFTVKSGARFEVIFCPAGRSTNMLQTK